MKTLRKDLNIHDKRNTYAWTHCTRTSTTVDPGFLCAIIKKRSVVHYCRANGTNLSFYMDSLAINIDR